MNITQDDVVKVIPRGNGDVMLLGVIAIVSLGIVAYVFVKGDAKNGKGKDTGVTKEMKQERDVNENVNKDKNKDAKERNENTKKHKGGKDSKSIKPVTPGKTQDDKVAAKDQPQQQPQVINTPTPTPTPSQTNVQDTVTNIPEIKRDTPQSEPVVHNNDDHTNSNKADTNDVLNTIEDIITTTVVPPIDIAPPEFHASNVEATTAPVNENENEQAKPKAKKTKKKKPSKKENKQQQQQQETPLSLKPITSTENTDDSGWIEVGSKKSKAPAQTKQKQVDQIYKDYLDQY